MHKPDDIQYALETTRVLREPDRRIDTFGDTRFEFQLISELMDQVGQVRIRTGEVEAMRPRILRPEPYREIELEGFDDSARALLTDPQTSGGLLVACAPEVVTEVLSIFLQQGFDHAVVIGELGDATIERPLVTVV